MIDSQVMGTDTTSTDTEVKVEEFDPAEYLDVKMETEFHDDSIELDEKADTKPEWVEDETVPPGYRRRVFDNNLAVSSHGMPAVLGPDGSQYRSRVGALRNLLRKEAPEQEIEAMLTCLEFERWEPHQLLPTKRWRWRKVQHDFHKTGIELLSENMEIFKSIKDAFKYAKSNFSEEIFIQLESFIDLMSVELRMETYDWREDDSVPSGWKMRVADGKTQKEFFLSPDGRSFQNRTCALQYMIKENYEEEEIDQMKLMMVEHENWQFSGKVPFGWLIKEDSLKSKYHVIFLTREGEILKSFIRALEYFKHNESYSNLDSELLQQLADERSTENRVKGYEWIESKSLPVGWKFRRHVGKIEQDFILSPRGEQFPCRRLAYMSMFEDHYSPGDIEIMRQFLIEEDWSRHKNLPNEKWLFARRGINVFFLSDCGKYFKSFKKAHEFIKKHFTEAEVNKLNALLEMDSIRKRTVRYTWNQDSTVPDGWLTREVKGKVRKLFLLSPDGEQFCNRRSALQFMIRSSNYSEEDLQIMRDSMREEDWEEHSDLPKGWLVRITRRNVKEVLFTREGDILESQISGREYMESNGYGQSYLSKLSDVFEDISRKVRSGGADERWESDDRLPDGFKVRTHSGKVEKTFYLSRDGSQFSSLKLLLIRMLEKNYDEDDVRKVKDLMCEEDGYEEDRFLPKNWIMRYIFKKYKTDSGISVTLISNKGKVFQSFVAAIEMMEASEEYIEQDIKNLKNLMNEKSSNRRQTEESWQEDETLPAGWRFRKPVGAKTDKTLYLSPEGDQFQSRVRVLLHMINNNYPEDAVKVIRESLLLEGFEVSRYLPANWLVRYKFFPAGSLDLTVISHKGVIFQSFSAVMEMMKNSKKYRQKDIDNVNKYIVLKRRERRKSSDTWETDPELPAGWKFKNTARKDTVLFLSPKLKVIHGRRALYKHFIKIDQVDAVGKLKKYFVTEDRWTESKYLPSGWLYRARDKTNESGHGYHFLSREGEFLQSIPAVIDYIKVSKSYTESDRDRLSKFLPYALNEGRLVRASKTEPRSSMTKSKSTTSRVWTKDSSVPSSWRISESEGGKVFRDSKGKIFRSRRLALAQMISNKAGVEDIRRMREGLGGEGWNRSSLLPRDWWYKLNKDERQRINVITEDAGLLSDSKTIKEVIKEKHSRYYRKFDFFMKTVLKNFYG